MTFNCANQNKLAEFSSKHFLTANNKLWEKISVAKC